METFEAVVRGICSEIADILIERQKQHGSQAIDEIGNIGVYHQIRNKAARMHAKIQPDGTWRNDPTDDCIDLAGYAVIQLMRYRGQWGVPLADELVQQAMDAAGDLPSRRVREIADRVQHALRSDHDA